MHLFFIITFCWLPSQPAKEIVSFLGGLAKSPSKCAIFLADQFARQGLRAKDYSFPWRLN